MGNELHCRVCLSSHRQLTPLSQITESSSLCHQLLEWIERVLKCKLTRSVQICWECKVNFSKMVLFVKRIQKANILLQEKENLKSLSNLASTKISGVNMLLKYMEQQPNITDLRSIQYENIGCNQSDDETTNLVREDFDNDINMEVIKNKESPKGTKSEKLLASKSCKTNQWATVKAIENKMPKFKIFNTKDKTGFRNMYYKRKIDLKYVEKLLEDERKSESFRKQQYKCISCVKVFDCKKKIEHHIKAYHNEQLGSFSCNICCSRFLRKASLVKHINTHCYVYECSVCLYTSSNKLNIVRHLRAEHGKIYKCVKCRLKYGSRREFREHFKEQHERFTCNSCGITFKMKYCIEEHIRKQHSPIRCVPCNKTFARHNGLWLHNKLHHSTTRMEPAYCVECNKTYANAFSYKWHLGNCVRHTPRKRRSIPCPACDKVFTKNIYMKDHYDLVHLKIFKYRCEQCDKNFLPNADLVKHKRRTHDGIPPAKDKMCYVCGRGFSSNKILSNHLRVHSGERPFVCAACPARFTQRAAAKSHAVHVHKTAQ